MEPIKNELLTVPNMMSSVGYWLVCDGVERGVATPEGLAEVFVGRMLDIGDGFAARLLGQSSALGALLDASLDKLASKKILDAVTAENLVPPIFETAMVAQNTTSAALTAAAKALRPDRRLTPSKEGKYSMALQGLALGSYALAEVVRPKRPQVARFVRGVGHSLGAAGLFYYGPQATAGYARRLG